MKYLSATARISEDGVYRYSLSRSWARGEFLCWVMLNPSTADAAQDDPTIRRVVGFTRSWGYAGCVVVNLYALRATNPRELADHPDPVGPDNDETIASYAGGNLPTVCAWGAHKLARPRVRRFLDLVSLPVGGLWTPLYCLGLTKDEAPKHPLYAPHMPRPKVLYRVTLERAA